MPFMKYLIIFLIPLALASCSPVIPMQANLSDQTLLLSKNKNIKPEFELESWVVNGPLTQINVQKNGEETTNNYFEYSSETAFQRIWTSYFSSKFNSLSSDTMEVNITLQELYIKNNISTSIAGTLITGNSQYNAEAVAIIEVFVVYQGEEYKNRIEATSSEFNETQATNIGGVTYYRNETNPMQQKAKLLESALNKSVIQFDNYMTSILEYN